jgi:hypothetical protein
MFREENRNQRAGQPFPTGIFTFFAAKKQKKLNDLSALRP